MHIELSKKSSSTEYQDIGLLISQMSCGNDVSKN